jgi:ABC-type glutathione transport system ATPase component
VGRDVFNAVIGPQGLLARRGTTRILVTHAVAVLKHVDRIVVMRGGTTAETGTLQAVLFIRTNFFRIRITNYFFRIRIRIRILRLIF